jgi:hypothetical protein
MVSQIVEDVDRYFNGLLARRFQVFSKRGMSLERPDLGDARSVDPL